MAYRTYVGTTDKDEIQILGNNEFYQPFIDELKRQGYHVEDGCYGIEFENDDAVSNNIAIKEIQPIIDILEQYIFDKDTVVKEYDESIFNLRPTNETNFTYAMIDLQENAYIFVTANLINYLKDNIEKKYDSQKKKFVHTIKTGKKVWFRAY